MSISLYNPDENSKWYNYLEKLAVDNLKEIKHPNPYDPEIPFLHIYPK